MLFHSGSQCQRGEIPGSQWKKQNIVILTGMVQVELDIGPRGVTVRESIGNLFLFLLLFWISERFLKLFQPTLSCLYGL